jgi:perosamine synthetase
MEKIKLVKLDLGEEELNAVKRVFESGWLTQGPVVKEFECEFARYLGVKNAISTTSCTTALDLALLTLDIGPDDEVIVPDFTFPATGNVVFHVGAKPVLVDIDIESYNIDPARIEKAITEKTKAIMPVHLFGQSAEMNKIMELAEKHGLYVIEDAAGGIGSTHHGKKAGTFGDMACFSFHPRKTLTVGEGGMLVTNDDELAEKARVIRDHGRRKDLGMLGFVYPGYNFRLSEIASAIGLIQLKKVDALIEKRIQLARVYDELLCDTHAREEIVAPHSPSYNKHAYQSYCLLIKKEKKRDELITKLAEKGVETQIGTYAMHLQPYYIQHADIAPASLAFSEMAFKNTLVLPIYAGLGREEQSYICSNLIQLLRF